jgi:hypothetical protein
MIRLSNAFFLLVGLLIFASSVRSEESELPIWLLHTKFSGDFRYLHEYIYQEEFADSSITSYDRNRHRIRLRVSMISSPSDRVSVGFRLAGGTGDRRSTNQDLTGSFSPKEFWIDRAYLDYHPRKGLSFIAGKAALPFVTTSQLVWDSDINPEGISVIQSGKLLGLDAQLVGGGFWLQEYKKEDDQGLLAAQGTLKKDTDGLDWQLSAGYYDYQNAKDGAVFVEAAGNSTQTRGEGSTRYYKYDYDLLNVSGKADAPFAAKTTFSFFFEIVENTAIGQNRQGALGGMSVSGSGKLPYSVLYSYRDIEADATIAAFTWSDFANGSTDASGHEIGLSLSPLDELKLNATLLLNTSQKSTRELDYKRLMVDATVKF